MFKMSRQPYGFRNLLAYQKAETLQMECRNLTKLFPPGKTMWDLADQMDRSVRSTKQNIVEGWKRNSTKEYHQFLGFSIGALTELEEDCNDIWRGVYRELMGIKGIMGEKVNEMGIKGEMGTPLTPLTPLIPSRPLSPAESQTPLIPLHPLTPFDIEKIPFYPLDKNLPPIVQLKLKCKELNFLLAKLQKSLEEKMMQEKTISANDLARVRMQESKKGGDVLDEFLKQKGFRRLENGQVVLEE